MSVEKLFTHVLKVMNQGRFDELQVLPLLWFRSGVDLIYHGLTLTDGEKAVVTCTFDRTSALVFVQFKALANGPVYLRVALRGGLGATVQYCIMEQDGRASDVKPESNWQTLDESFEHNNVIYADLLGLLGALAKLANPYVSF